MIREQILEMLEEICEDEVVKEDLPAFLLNSSPTNFTPFPL